MGRGSVVISPGEFGRTQTLSLSWVNGRTRALVTDGPGSRTLGDVAAVWPRRFADVKLPPALLGNEDRSFAAREWSQAVDGLLASLDAPFMSSVAAQRAAVKPRQLAAARTAGFRVPATLLTSNRQQALSFIEEQEQRVVLKSLSPHRTRPMYTRLWRAEDARHLDKLSVAPALFQEHVPGIFDVRVTVVGSRLFAARARLDADVLDIRLRPDEPYEQVDLPAPVQASIIRLMEDLGLVFGCVDLRMTPDDEYVFFEVNPQGQFLFVEVWTGQSITRAVADLLNELSG